MLLQECIYSYVLKINGNVASGVRLVLTLWESISTAKEQNHKAKHDIIFFHWSISVNTPGWVALSLFLNFKFHFILFWFFLLFVPFCPIWPTNIVLLQVLCNGFRNVFLSKNRSPNQIRWTPLRGSLSKNLLCLYCPIHIWAQRSCLSFIPFPRSS
jgi:hypothetical protein